MIGAAIAAVGLLTGCTAKSPVAMSDPVETVAAASIEPAIEPEPTAAPADVIELVDSDEPVPAAGSSPASGVVPSLDEIILFVPVKIPADSQLQPPDGSQEVWMTAKDGSRLYGWWWPHPQPTAHVLYLHGNSGNLWTCARYITWLHDQAGCSVLAVDYRGYGYSEGTPTVDGVLLDVRAARAELCRRCGVEPGGEVIIGRSLGGALAVDLAAETPPRGLVLESTFSSFREVAQHHAGVWAEMVPPARLNSKARLATYPGPLLQVHGDADRVVPFPQGRALYEVAPGPKRFVCIPGGGHNNSLTSTYRDELQKFLRELPN